jgi:hypothetical protein
VIVAYRFQGLRAQRIQLLHSWDTVLRAGYSRELRFYHLSGGALKLITEFERTLSGPVRSNEKGVIEVATAPRAVCHVFQGNIV